MHYNDVSVEKLKMSGRGVWAFYTSTLTPDGAQEEQLLCACSWIMATASLVLTRLSMRLTALA